MSFVGPPRLIDMEHEESAAELLLSEPDFVAWLDNLPVAPERTDSPECRPAEVRLPVLTAVARQSRMAA